MEPKEFSVGQVVYVVDGRTSGLPPGDVVVILEMYDSGELGTLCLVRGQSSAVGLPGRYCYTGQLAERDLEE